MSLWHREITQMVGAAVAVLGLALIVLAYLGPLVATGAALVGLGLAGLAFGYVGLVGPDRSAPPADALDLLMARTRQPDPDLRG